MPQPRDWVPDPPESLSFEEREARRHITRIVDWNHVNWDEVDFDHYDQESLQSVSQERLELFAAKGKEHARERAAALMAKIDSF